MLSRAAGLVNYFPGCRSLKSLPGIKIRCAHTDTLRDLPGHQVVAKYISPRPKLKNPRALKKGSRFISASHRDWNLKRPEIFMPWRVECRRRGEIVEEVKSQYSDHWPLGAAGIYSGPCFLLRGVIVCGAMVREHTRVPIMRTRRAPEMECARAQVACPAAPAKRLCERAGPLSLSLAPPSACAARNEKRPLGPRQSHSTPARFLAKFHRERRLFRPAINIRPAGFCPKVDQARGLIVLGDVTCLRKSVRFASCS